MSADPLYRLGWPMAGVGLTLLYLALFRLGSDSASLVDQSANGAAILHAYVQHTFGGGGSFLLAALSSSPAWSRRLA
ncbi:branched-chain amino acid transport system II carrier protein [Shigella sonnei]